MWRWEIGWTRSYFAVMKMGWQLKDDAALLAIHPTHLNASCSLFVILCLFNCCRPDAIG